MTKATKEVEIEEVDEEATESTEAPQRGVYIALTPVEGGEDQLAIHPVNIDPLAITAIVLMASKLVKQNLDL